MKISLVLYLQSHSPSFPIDSSLLHLSGNGLGSRTAPFSQQGVFINASTSLLFYRRHRILLFILLSSSNPAREAFSHSRGLSTLDPLDRRSSVPAAHWYTQTSSSFLLSLPRKNRGSLEYQLSPLFGGNSHTRFSLKTPSIVTQNVQRTP